MRGFTMAMLGLCFGIGLASPASAGTVVEGVGNTRSAAMDDANNRAAMVAQQRFPDVRPSSRCVTLARLDSCRQNQGEWVCRAAVANHRGSC